MINKGCDNDEIVGTRQLKVEKSCLKEKIPSIVTYICTLDTELNYKQVNGNNDYCMVTSPNSMLFIGLKG